MTDLPPAANRLSKGDFLSSRFARGVSVSIVAAGRPNQVAA